MEDAKSLIEQLLETDMTETEISDELKKLGVEVTQATINRLKNGVHKTTSFEVGYGLMQLRKQRSQRQRA